MMCCPVIITPINYNLLEQFLETHYIDKISYVLDFICKRKKWYRY